MSKQQRLTKAPRNKGRFWRSIHIGRIGRASRSGFDRPTLSSSTFSPSTLDCRPRSVRARCPAQRLCVRAAAGACCRRAAGAKQGSCRVPAGRCDLPAARGGQDRLRRSRQVWRHATRRAGVCRRLRGRTRSRRHAGCSRQRRPDRVRRPRTGRPDRLCTVHGRSRGCGPVAAVRIFRGAGPLSIRLRALRTLGRLSVQL